MNTTYAVITITILTLIVLISVGVGIYLYKNRDKSVSDAFSGLEDDTKAGAKAAEDAVKEKVDSK